MKNNIDGSDINVGSIEEEIKVGDIVELKSKHIGKVININEFREPSMKYGIDIKGFRDIAFVGEYAIVRKVEDNIKEDIGTVHCDRCRNEYAEKYYKDEYGDEIICEECLLELDGITTSTTTNYFIDGEYIGNDEQDIQNVIDEICEHFSYKEIE